MVDLFNPWLTEYLPLLAENEWKFKHIEILLEFIKIDIRNSLPFYFWEREYFEYFKKIVEGFTNGNFKDNYVNVIYIFLDEISRELGFL